MKILLHRKRAGSHENSVDKLETQAQAILDKVATDKENTRQALLVLTTEVARMDQVHERLRKLTGQ